MKVLHLTCYIAERYDYIGHLWHKLLCLFPFIYYCIDNGCMLCNTCSLLWYLPMFIVSVFKCLVFDVKDYILLYVAKFSFPPFLLYSLDFYFCSTFKLLLKYWSIIDSSLFYFYFIFRDEFHTSFLLRVMQIQTLTIYKKLPFWWSLLVLRWCIMFYERKRFIPSSAFFNLQNTCPFEKQQYITVEPMGFTLTHPVQRSHRRLIANTYMGTNTNRHVLSGLSQLLNLLKVISFNRILQLRKTEF